MLIAPLVWHDCVPGVIDTGLFNQHFIQDIGIIQLVPRLRFRRRESRIHLRSGKIAILTEASAELMAQTNHQTGALPKSLGRAGIRGAILCSPPA